LRLVGAHQRTAAGIAEDDDAFDTGLFLQPTHADADVDQRVFQQEERFVTTKARIPTQKSEATLRHELAEIVFTEVDVVVRRDERRVRAFPNRRVVQTLARMKPGAVARRRWGNE
jgi:hypothetical protein